MSKREWTKQQKQCIYAHDGTLLVSAAAGSGKTSVLVQRIVERITHPEHPIDVDRLLVVTFTRAAAAEMKSRLAKALSECSRERPDDANLLRQQLLLPRASIGTVDSFCGELVRQNFHMLDIPPQFRVAEEQQLALLKKEALNETIDALYAEADPAFEELAAMLSNGKNDNTLMELIGQIEQFLQSHRDPEAWLQSMIAAYDAADSAKQTPWGKFIADTVADGLKKAEQLYTVALSLASADVVLNDRYLPMIADELHFVQRAREACDMGTWDELAYLLNRFEPQRLGDARKCNDAALRARVKSLRDTAKDVVAKQAELMDRDEKSAMDDILATRGMALTLYAAVRRFSNTFMEKKKAARLFGFSDITRMALGLLTVNDENGKPMPTALARELSERYDEILIDEYQDTNEMQDALFSALSRDESNMFFVGDVKQSIYAFRQAMPKLFLGRRSRYPLFDGAHYPATVVLGNNFRSRREVTEAVNFVFRQLMTEEVGGLRYDENEELVCSADYDEGAGYEPEVLISETETANGEKLSAHEADAATVAKRIEELVGTMMVSDKDHGKRPLRYGDCCILLRNRTGEYREALEQRGIPVVTDDAGEFFDTAEIRLALSVLRCIDNPLLDVPLSAWLLSPLCGFSVDDLATVSRCRPHTALYTALTAARQAVDDPELAARCREAVAFLERYRALACQLTVDQLLRRLYEETALPELMSARADGERRCANLRLLQESCAQFDQSGFRGLAAFVRYIDRLQAQGISLPGAVGGAAGDAVQICTIHKSKGLEYPVVFLSCLHRSFSSQYLRTDLLLHPERGAGIKRREPITLQKYPSLPYRALALAISNDQRAEELRLLYVAMTRAREKLFLTMGIPNAAKKLATLAATLDDAPIVAPFAVRDASSMGDWVLSALLRHPSAAEWRHLIDRDDLPLLPGEYPWALRLCLPELPTEDVAEEQVAAVAEQDAIDELRVRMAYRYPHEALAQIPAKIAASNTANGTVERKFVAHAQPAFMNRVGLSPAERGTAMHTFMQHADYARAAQDAEAEIRRAVQDGFLTEEQAAALDRRKLKAFFGGELYARMARSSRCLREYPFTSLQPASRWENTVSNEELLVVQGMTDCVFEEEGELVIVDYKTDRVTDAAELIERYRGQLNIYREALGRAMAMPVRECLLYSFALDSAIPVPVE